MVLEQHERDFLKAYRKHMISVQQELQDLKSKGTDAELQLRQEQKIKHLETEIRLFKDQCIAIMNQVTTQTKHLKQLQMQWLEITDNVAFLDSSCLESRVEKYNL